MTTEPLEAKATAEPLWKRALPFVLAAGLVGFVLYRLDLRAFVGHLARVNAPAFVGFALLFLLALLSADAFGTAFVYRRSVAPVRYGELWVLRGASYLPSLLNHHVGQAFLTVAIARGHGVPLARVAGGTLVVYASWLGSVLGLGVLALVATGRPLVFAAAIVAVGLAYLVVIRLRPPWLAKNTVLAPLFETGVTGHLLALVARLPHLVVLFAGTWLPFSFFGVEIPFREALATIPVLMVAVTLPLTPQGFGTRDVLAALFFERFAVGATHEARLSQLAAATTSWGVVLTLLEALVGLVLLRSALPRMTRRAARDAVSESM